MKRLLMVLSFLSLVAMPSLSFATPLTVQNFSFETANLALSGNGVFSQLIPNSTIFAQGGTLGSWTASSTTTGAAAGGFSPSAGGSNWTTTWWSNSNIGYVQINQVGTVSLSQVLTDNLLSNTVYTLTADVGRRSFTPSYICSLELWAGTTLLNATACPSLAANSSGTQTVVYNSGASNAHAGEALKIVLSSTNSGTALQEGFWDSVRLDAATTTVGVPEPTSLSLIGVGGVLLLGVWIRRRQAPL